MDWARVHLVVIVVYIFLIGVKGEREYWGLKWRSVRSSNGVSANGFGLILVKP